MLMLLRLARRRWRVNTAAEGGGCLRGGERDRTCGLFGWTEREKERRVVCLDVTGVLAFPVSVASPLPSRSQVQSRVVRLTHRTDNNLSENSSALASYFHCQYGVITRIIHSDHTRECGVQTYTHKLDYFTED